MIRTFDANFIRICKLAGVAGGIGFCVAAASFFLHGNFRQIAAGTTAGLTFAVAAALVEAYRRRAPVDARPAAVETKARRGRAAATIGVLLGVVGFEPVRLLHAELFAMGFFVGSLAFLVLVISPLFWTRPRPRVESSPRARMTSVERAVNVRYE
jgi:hypothetical protein